MWKSKLKGNGTWIALFILVVAATVFYGTTFLSVSNIFNVLRQSSMIGLIAVGMTCVIITAGIDLSVGATVALTAVSAAVLTQTSVLLALIVPVFIGILIGAVNGFVIAKLKIVPFIATLAVQMAVRGIAYIATDVKSVPIADEAESFLVIGRGHFLGIPIPVILFALAAAVMIFVCSKTPFGRSLYAIGGNEDAARCV